MKKLAQAMNLRMARPLTALVCIGALIMASGCSDDEGGSESSRAGRAGISSDPGTLTVAPQLEALDGGGGRLLAIYMVGSDLEGNGGAGTADFKEMVAGFNALTNAQKDNVNVVVAFGGADKAGWKGMKIAEIDTIVADAADGKFGNLSADEYLYSAPRANMGDQSSLTLFLNFVKSSYTNYSVRNFVFWDHGSAYGPFGNDQNFNMDGLELSEITASLTASNPGKFDVIGFDACLNASVEVAQAIDGFGDLLVGSEELEPGHGWNYEFVVNNLATAASPNAFASGLVDNFVKHDSHPYKSDGKTLSVLDMSKFAELRSRLDALYVTLANKISADDLIYDAVVTASTKTFGFGKAERGDQRIAVDVKQLIDLMQTRVSASEDAELADQLSAAEAALGQFVIKTAHDGTRPSSNGVNIAPPDVNAAAYRKHALTQSVVALAEEVASEKSQDNEAPDIADEDNCDPDFDDCDEGFNEKPSAAQKAQATNADDSGIRARFKDDNIASVNALYGFTTVDSLEGRDVNYLLPVVELPATEGDRDNEFVAEAWDQRGFFLRYGSSEDDEAFLPAKWVEDHSTDEGNFAIWSVELDIAIASESAGEDVGDVEQAVLLLTVDENSAVVSHRVRIYQEIYASADSDEFILLFDRNDRQLGVGDSVEFFGEGFALDGSGLTGFVSTTDDLVTVTSVPVFEFDEVTFGDDESEALPVAALIAEDFSGNFTLSDPKAAVVTPESQVD